MKQLQEARLNRTPSTSSSSSCSQRYVKIHEFPHRQDTSELNEGQAKSGDSDDKSAVSYSSQTTRQDSGKDDIDDLCENTNTVGTTPEEGEVDDINRDKEEPSVPPPTASARQFNRSISLFEGNPPVSLLSSYKKGMFARQLSNINDNSEECEELLPP